MIEDYIVAFKCGHSLIDGLNKCDNPLMSELVVGE